MVEFSWNRRRFHVNVDRVLKMESCEERGYLFLIRKYSLKVCDLFLQSFVTDRSAKDCRQEGDYQRKFYPRMRFSFEDSWQAQLVFALKYEGVNIEVLRALFPRLPAGEVGDFVAAHPLGAIQKRIWFLYEYLTGLRLDIPDGDGGTYLPLIDERFQYALPIADGVRERRYHIVNNMIGNLAFSPFIRRTDRMRKFGSAKLREECNQLLEQYSPDLLYRAIQYLYVKETKSSFAIERETPSQRRTEAFVAILRNMIDSPLTKEQLVAVQNAAVDERYRQSDWRRDQVYVGQTITPGFEKVHFIAPRSDAINELMDGFLTCLAQWMKSSDSDPVVIAAVMSFAFVFLHPFDDGNGRVHRYLMHAILAQRGFVPKGLIFPISAVILKDQLAYDKVLETFSLRVMPRLDYSIDAEGEISVVNDSRDYYRAIDYTPIVEYFQEVVARTIRTEWKSELDYLKRYDRIRQAMQQIVDMPEKKANQFILFVQQNGGHLSQRKRSYFAELSDEEICQLEKIVHARI